MPPLKIAVLATGDLALPALSKLAETEHEIACLWIHPGGLGEDALPEELEGDQVEAWARERGIPVLRPPRPDSEKNLETLAELGPDLGLEIAYGRSFPEGLLDTPKKGWIKLHYSNLPRYRGLFPIRAAIWHGEKEVGASIIQITEEEPDSGPILVQDTVPIAPTEIYGTVAPRVADLGAELLTKAVASVAKSKKPKVKKQKEKSASPSPVFAQQHLRAPWWRKADDVYNRLRALSPEPGLFTMIRRRKIRILKGAPTEWVQEPFAENGSYLGLRIGRIAVLCGEGTVFGIERVQTRDGREQTAADFAREAELRVGTPFV